MIIKIKLCKYCTYLYAIFSAYLTSLIHLSNLYTMNTISIPDFPDGTVGGTSGTREIDSIKIAVKITKCKLTKVINKAQKSDLLTKKSSLNTINQFYDDLKKLHHELIHKVASNQSDDENIDSLVSDTINYEDKFFANIMALKLDVEETN